MVSSPVAFQIVDLEYDLIRPTDLTTLAQCRLHRLVLLSSGREEVQ